MSSVSNGLYFLTLPLVSVMRIIYTSKGMSKKFGVCVIYRKIRYIRSKKSVTCYRKVCCYDYYFFLRAVHGLGCFDQSW